MSLNELPGAPPMGSGKNVVRWPNSDIKELFSGTTKSIKKKSSSVHNEDGTFTASFLERSATLRAIALEKMTDSFNKHIRACPITFKKGVSRQSYDDPVNEDGQTLKDIFNGKSESPVIITKPWKTQSEALAYYGANGAYRSAMIEVTAHWEHLEKSENIGIMQGVEPGAWGTYIANPEHNIINIVHDDLTARGYKMAQDGTLERFYGLFDSQNRLISFYIISLLNVVGIPMLRVAVDEMDKLWEYRMRLINCVEWNAQRGTVRTVTGYDKDGKFVIEHSEISEDAEMSMPCFYPWFKDDLTSYIREYIDSKGAVLVLIGDPGTGKSTFLRTGIRMNSLKALMVTKPEIFMHPSFIPNCKAAFKADTANLIVMEDADMYIRPRVKEHGDEKNNHNNHRMSELLEATSGIGTGTDVPLKFVFTTNLKSIDEVDSALLRPGRAFDYLRFRGLSRNEVAEVRKATGLRPLAYNKDIPTDRLFTLAEALASSEPSVKNAGIIAPRY